MGAHGPAAEAQGADWLGMSSPALEGRSCGTVTRSWTPTRRGLPALLSTHTGTLWAEEERASGLIPQEQRVCPRGLLVSLLPLLQTQPQSILHPAARAIFKNNSSRRRGLHCYVGCTGSCANRWQGPGEQAHTLACASPAWALSWETLTGDEDVASSEFCK